jgi:hypothetical protein
MTSQGRIALDTFPEDWKYYTLKFPVARYKHLSPDRIIEEIISCDKDFYSTSRILRRLWDSLFRYRKPLINLISNLSYRGNFKLNCNAYIDFKHYLGSRHEHVKLS